MGRIFLLWCLLASPWAMAESPAVEGSEATHEASGALSFPPLEDPPDETVATARIKRLSTALRCPVCQGLSVSDSPSDAARAMGDRIAELVRMGYTEDQVTEYFVDRYGPWVELEPPNEGTHRVLFWGPAVLITLGLLGLWAWSRRRDTTPSTAPAPSELTPELAPWRARILAELDEEAS